MVVPAPTRVRREAGELELTAHTKVGGPAELVQLVRRELGPPTGLPLPTRDAASADITVQLDDTLDAEAYRLSISPEAARLTGGGQAGVYYGIQTVRQLLPAAAFRAARLPGARWRLPAVDVEDAPRFGWRGCHLDVSRHFMPKPFLFRLVDLLAAHKLNVLHLHLTDDQGWRFESKRHPRLHEIGSTRAETRWPGKRRGDGRPHGGYYSQDDLRELVRYAADRFVTIVPEVELPGHAQAAIAAYPELGGDPTHPPSVFTTFGVNETVLNPELSTLRFFQDVYEEVLDVFPGTFVHVGGDECPKTQWSRSPRAQQLIRDRGLTDEDGLQSWFITEMASWLADHGRRLVGWDEILEGGLASQATVMSWRGQAGGVAAAKAGHDVVMAPTSHTYFDYYQSTDPTEPHAIGGHLPLEQVYAYEPVPTELSADEARHVLGSQCQVWTEYLATQRQVEYMLFPRACAFAEVVWSPTTQRSYDDFDNRLAEHLQRLDALGVEYRPTSGPHPWQRGGTARNR